MKNVRLGKTEIITPQNAFGALPIQRISVEAAAKLLQKAYEGGMTFFDTARAYTDSEEKIGIAFEGIKRESFFLATKTMARTGDEIKTELETSLKSLKMDYVDIYQLHCIPKVFKPEDKTGVYEALVWAKEQGLIRHFGITAHLINVAEEAVASGLYETLQFPFSYLASKREIELVEKCKDKDMGFIAMKGLAGGLLNNYRACAAFISQYDNVLPIWGVQKEKELDEWLSLFTEEAAMDEKIKAIIEADQKELTGDFCRGCGYCAPCTVGIEVNSCARMSQMVRRAPSSAWVTKEWQDKMEKIDECIECGVCMERCPYHLDIPKLLKKNIEDYRNIISGKIKV